MNEKFDNLKYTIDKLKAGLQASYQYNQANKYNIAGNIDKAILHKNLADNLAKYWDFNYLSPTPLDIKLVNSFLDPIDTDISSHLYYANDKANAVFEMLEMQNKAIDQIYLAEQETAIVLKYRHLLSAEHYNYEALDQAESCLSNFKYKTEIDSIIGEAVKEVRLDFIEAIKLSGQIETEICGEIHLDYSY